MESYWLQGRFIGGAKPCLADLLMACELQQLEMLEGSEGPERMEAILAPYARVRTWMKDVQEVSPPPQGEQDSGTWAVDAACVALLCPAC